MSCPFCGSDNPSQTEFCRACGAELPHPSASGASTDALPVGTVLLGTYAIESVLGQGGFGITYCCHDQMLDRQVAIKEFFPVGCRREDALVQPSRGLSDSHFSEARAQFLAEARLLARCHHAGIVGVHTAFEANSTAYMVMELLHGSNLAQLLEARGGRLSEAEAVPFIERAGGALQFVHDKGLLHRDIKPENIIVCDDGRVMLIDFGTAREYAQGQAQGHTIVVTPGYAPLEQYARQAKRGAFTDVYGLAATLYHLLTGNQPPAASDRAVGVQLRPVREENPQISQGVAGAVEAGLRMEIAKRPQSVREFLGLIHAPATQALEAAAFEVALMPHENAMANAQRDALLALSSAPPSFFSGALQTRQQMLDETLLVPQLAQPIQLSPQFTPLPVLPPTTTSSVPSATSPNMGGGFLTKPAPMADNPIKIVFWFFGGITLFLGFVLWVGSSSQKTRPSGYSPTVTRQSWPNYSSPNYSSSTSQSLSPAYSRSITRNLDTIREAARREMESTPGIVPVSVETLPLSAKVPASQSKTAAKSDTATPYVLWQGLAEFSPDGQMVAYLDGEAVLRVWSLSNHRVVSSLPQSKSHPPVAVRFSPDAKNVVLTYQDQGARKSNDKVTVWNLATKKSLGTLSVDPKKEWLTARAVLPDGKVLVIKTNSGDNQRRLFLWDPRTGKQIPAPMKEIGDVSRLVVAANGQQIVTGDKTGRIHWWDGRTGVQKAEQSTNQTYQNLQASPFYESNTPWNVNLTDPLPVGSLRFSRNGSFLASNNAMQIRVFDSKAREIGDLLVGYFPPFAVSSDGQLVVEGGGYQDSEQNMLWKVRNRQKTRLQAPSGQIKAWSFSPDGKQIIGLSSSLERVSLVTWPTDAKPVAPFSSPRVNPLPLPTSVSQIPRAISLSNQLSAMQSGKRLEIRRFDGLLLNSLDVGESPITEVAFSPDGRFLSGRALKGETRIWNVKTGQQVAQLAALESVQGESLRSLYRGDATKNLLFSPDNSLLARTGNAQGKNLVEVWSLDKTPHRIATLTLNQPIMALTFSPDNRALIYGDGSGKLSYYDVATQKLKAATENGPGEIFHLVPTEQGLAVVSIVSGNRPDPLVTMYDLPSSSDTTGLPRGQKRRVFRKTSQVAFNDIRGGLYSMAISPDGQLVAAPYFNPPVNGVATWPPRHGVGIWHLPTGSLMQTLPLEMSESEASPGDMSFIEALSFAPDGSQLLCIKRDTTRRQQQVVSWQRPPREKPSR